MTTPSQRSSLFAGEFSGSFIFVKCHHSRKADLEFSWPTPRFEVVLVEPKIPPNTGNIARLCAGTGCGLHLVGELGFELSDKQLRRAGLDYWDSIAPQIHDDLDGLLDTGVLPEGRAPWLFSTGGDLNYFEAAYEPGDMLMFGSETEGLPDEILARWPNRVVGIPMQIDHVRSLNLATSVGIAVYEALRQVQPKSS